MIPANAKRPVVKMIGLSFFENGEHARVDCIPQKYILGDEVYQGIRKVEGRFSTDITGISFNSLNNGISFLEYSKGLIQDELGRILKGKVDVFVPTKIPQVLKYTGLDGYLGSENLDGEIFDLPYILNTVVPYYGGVFADKNGPIVNLPIVVKSEDAEGVIGKIGLVKVVAYKV